MKVLQSRFHFTGFLRILENFKRPAEIERVGKPRLLRDL